VIKPFDQATRSHWLPALGQRGWLPVLGQRGWVGRTLVAVVCALICFGTVGCGGSLPRSTPSESPDDRDHRTPGWYLLYVVTATGIPSKGSWIHLTLNGA
jgi:hypothetical protein